MRVSLTDVDGDGVLAVTMQEELWTSCFDLGPTYSQGRGVVTGTATVAGKDALDTTTELVGNPRRQRARVGGWFVCTRVSRTVM